MLTSSRHRGDRMQAIASQLGANGLLALENPFLA